MHVEISFDEIFTTQKQPLNFLISPSDVRFLQKTQVSGITFVLAADFGIYFQV
jgi:hypothetical protein